MDKVWVFSESHEVGKEFVKIRQEMMDKPMNIKYSAMQPRMADVKGMSAFVSFSPDEKAKFSGKRLLGMSLETFGASV